MSKRSTIALLLNARTDLLRSIDETQALMPENSVRHSERVYTGNAQWPGIDPKGWESKDTGYAVALDPLFEAVERMDATIAILEGKPTDETD